MAGESGGEGTGEDRDDRPDDVVDDDRDDDGTGEDRDDDADGGQDDGEDEYKPPTRDEWAKVQRSLARAKAERTKARAERDAARAQAAERDKPKTDQAAGGDLAAKDKDDAPQEDPRWQKVLRSTAAAQIRAAGFTGTADQAKRLTRLLDLAEVEPDADGDLDIEEQIDELKDEYPQLFRAQQEEEPPPRRVQRPTTADRGRQTDKDATTDPSKRTSAALRRMAGLR